MDDLLTCICCRLTFGDATTQRDHYRSDYHRFNLKRKVVGLPPVTEELFAEKTAELKEKQATTEIFSGYCQFCKKKFSNPKTYGMHVASKKHIERAQLARDLADDETLEGTTTTITKQPNVPLGGAAEVKKSETPAAAPVEAQTEDEYIAEKVKNAHIFDIDECVVCQEHSGGFEENLEHMANAHGLFIPDLEFVTDLEGLVGYMGQKVGTGNACLFCNKIFRTTEAVQNHMKSMTHGRLQYDAQDLEEFEEYYDFAQTWAAVDGEEADPNEDLTAEQQQILMVKSGKGILSVDENGQDLRLANGKVVIHRDLALLYKRNYHRILNRDPNATRAVLNRYRALGWKTSLTTQERKIQRKQHHLYYKEQQQVGWKSNRLQKFFREQVLY